MMANLQSRNDTLVLRSQGHVVRQTDHGAGVHLVFLLPLTWQQGKRNGT